MKERLLSLCTRLFLVLSFFAVVSCNSENNDSEVPDLKLFLEFKPQVDGQTLILGQEYTLGDQQVTFDFFKMYLSEIRVEDAAGEMAITPEDDLILLGALSKTIRLGTIEKIDISETTFSFGLPPDVNHQENPQSASDPLNDPEMNPDWDPSVGYTFMRIEGTVDSEPFSYHLNQDAFYVEVQPMSTIYNVDGNISMSIAVNLKGIFHEVELEPGDMHGLNTLNFEMSSNIASGIPFELQ